MGLPKEKKPEVSVFAEGWIKAHANQWILCAYKATTIELLCNHIVGSIRPVRQAIAIHPRSRQHHPLCVA
jgi:hypothetical protein